MRKLISFKTFRKYCNPDPVPGKWKRPFCIKKEGDIVCNQKNCPVWKRLKPCTPFKCYNTIIHKAL